ncbi:MAG: 50S ribosomal protein L3 [Chlamydiae bacterium]|nr:50S ribosomal protein L3 [Chlamydiota bacterium]
MEKQNILLMGKKIRMTQQFDPNGNVVACTVIEVEPNVVAQIKTQEKDGYNAVQLGFDKIGGKGDDTKKKRIGKPRFSHFAKNKLEPRRHLRETRVESTEEYALGQEIGVDIFEGIDFVDVTGTSKGKGFQGVMKRYGFSGGPASHGSGFHRTMGSTGALTVGVRPGSKMPGHMGDEKVTVENLRLLGVDKEKNIMLIKGAIPGANGSLVSVRVARKKCKK